VRRIEALTGPAAVELLRTHDRILGEAAQALRTRPEQVAELVQAREAERRQLEKQLKSGAGGASGGGVDVEQLAGRVAEVDGAQVLAALVEVPEAKALLDLADRLKGKLPEAAIVLGSAAEGRASLLVAVAPGLVERGVRAGQIVKQAAAEVGGGGGGRDTLAQAGGREPEKLEQALETAKAAIASALAAG
jgi:alanyl-tRNA synthetase